MSRTASRTSAAMSAYPVVVTSPAMWTWPVVMRVSTATRARGSSVSSASRTVSLIRSAILSGWPSVTDSEVNRRSGTTFLRCAAVTGDQAEGGAGANGGRARPAGVSALRVVDREDGVRVRVGLGQLGGLV